MGSKQISFFGVFIGLMFWAVSGWAQSEDAVIVLLHGGVDSVRALDLDSNDEVVELGDEKFADMLWTGSDIKRLPGGGHLLAQASGAGFAIFNTDGSLQFQFDESLRFRDVSSASVAGYVSLTEPGRILLADSFQGVASIRDIRTGQLVWFQNLQVQGRFPTFAQAIVMPDNKVAVAANWPAIGLSAIDLFSFGGGMITRQQFANFVGVEAPDATIPLDALAEGISDIYGLADGAFLVSTPFEVFQLESDGTIGWRFDIREQVAIGGEIEAARLLDSGRVAFATFERGKWISGHPNHGVHWIDPTTQTWIASSTPLNRAPASMDTYSGHGATGTRNFEAGLGDLSLGSLDDILAVNLTMGRLEFERGDILRPQVDLSNQGMYPVVLTTVRIEASPAACGDEAARDVVLAAAEDATITPATSFRLADERTVDFDFELGVWCARVVATDFNGNTAALSELEFEVAVMASDGEDPVDIRDLNFSDSAPDMGVDAGVIQPPPQLPADEGCGCTSSPRTDAAAWLVVLMLIISAGRLSARGRAHQ